MEDRHATYPVHAGASGVVMWVAIALAVIGAVGFVVTVATTGA